MGRERGRRGKSYILLPNFFCSFSNIWASSHTLVITVIAASMVVRNSSTIQVCYHSATKSPSLMFHFLKSTGDHYDVILSVQ